jgi:hypothetical protein
MYVNVLFITFTGMISSNLRGKETTDNADNSIFQGKISSYHYCELGFVA